MRSWAAGNRAVERSSVLRDATAPAEPSYCDSVMVATPQYVSTPCVLYGALHCPDDLCGNIGAAELKEHLRDW
jgi:hypothetical protein